MSSRYKIADPLLPHFITCTIIHWIDIFTRLEYRDIIVKSLAYCTQHKGLQIHGWVVTSNHIHLIVSASEGKPTLPEIIRDFKKFTSSELYAAVKTNLQESRKQWMLRSFDLAGKNHPDNISTKVWQDDYHPVYLNHSGMFDQRLTYIHQNPVLDGFVNHRISNIVALLIIMNKNKVYFL